MCCLGPAPKRLGHNVNEIVFNAMHRAGHLLAPRWFRVGTKGNNLKIIAFVKCKQNVENTY